MRTIVFIFLLCIVSGATLKGQEKSKRDTLNFQFEGKTLSGYIDMPSAAEPSALVILIPGHGKTSFRDPSLYFDSLIYTFREASLAVFRWDRAGCGNSEGIYHHNQTVQSSAEEALMAIEELKRRNVPGSKRIGLWGLSRGGYICPLIIQRYRPIAFWISVSGTDGLNSWDYMFESDMRFAGKTAAEAELLLSEYLNGLVVMERGGSYEEYLVARQHLLKDSFCISYLGLTAPTPESYKKDQAAVMADLSYERDPKSKSVIVVPKFKKVLTKIPCPVLAIFGEKDFIVDWQKTKALYENTISKKKLTTMTFHDGNHGLLKCKTGAANEKLETFEFCDGYFDTITQWLAQEGFAR